ncbi:hypothetical protein M422DRAFT_165839 [Sphaerobolus stellatus SS14]|uniref:Unplaced genomic scaffold SPHSTscaffold_35, whole genome shotgun sequence n=1 Tax=Sphaerobolus stellatus (strain SS14) TaxID=990650 RepID=A0A0C9W2G9_SPHS4|nr:hypothetical protein M422DRAFT_165839 [Sphaerobolus stellatus SS14]
MVSHRSIASWLTSSWQLPALLVASLFLILLIVRNYSFKNLPPGPKGLPIIGNALDMPTDKEWLKFTKWKQQYGNIIHLSVFGSPIIVLSSAQDAYELLGKRSNIYSDRAKIAMLDLIGWCDSIILVRNGPTLRHMRRLISQSLTPTTWIIQERATTKFLESLLKSPEGFRDHLRHTAGSIILKLAYGYDVVDSDKGKDPFVELAEIAISEFSTAANMGAFLVNFIPCLKYIPAWMPGAGFQRTAAAWRKNTNRMIGIPYDFTKSQVAAGIAEPSLTSLHLHEVRSEKDEALLKWAATGVYGGGADTTVSSLITFFLCMCLNPDVQQKAQAEIDHVIGQDRLPLISDRNSLPYVEAVMKEVLRWLPVAPLGVPHLLAEDDIYNGYHLPRNSLIISNLWAMTRDPKYFKNSEEFRPERYLEDKIDSSFADPLQIVFGFGKRTCIGQRLAEPSVFIAIAMTLATFNIEKQTDSLTGEVIEPVVDVLPGVIATPKIFPCKITPRSSNAVELIKRMAS